MTREEFKCILDTLFDGVYCVDKNRQITYWNAAAQTISGFTSEEIQGRRCGETLLRHISTAGEPLCHGMCPLAATLKDGISREAEVFLHHKKGHRVPVTVRISPIYAADGSIEGAVEVFTDSRSNHRLVRELADLKRQAMLDPLTGLGNRRSAAREFDRRMSEYRRFGFPFGLLFADIDLFKNVNDTHGHETGDHVLVAVAKTLGNALRDIDSVCRWGGEEFLAIVPHVDEATFLAVAERLRRFVEYSPIPTASGELSITVSVGGAMALEGDTLESLAARADAMMYKAKRSGRNCVVLDCPGLDVDD